MLRARLVSFNVLLVLAFILCLLPLTPVIESAATAPSPESFAIADDSQPQVTLLSQPVRIVDTRSGSGYLGAGQPLQGINSPRCYKLTERAGVPAEAKAVIVNLTAVGYTRDGWIAAYPYDPANTGVPSTSSVNYDTAENAIANFAIVKLGQGGQVCLTGSSPTNAIIDVSGYLR